MISCPDGGYNIGRLRSCTLCEPGQLGMRRIAYI